MLEIPNLLIICLHDLYCYDVALEQKAKRNASSTFGRIGEILKTELAYKLKIEDELVYHANNRQIYAQLKAIIFFENESLHSCI